MWVKLINKQTKDVLCTADISFGLDVLCVNKCDKLKVSELESFLQNRAEFRDSFEMDEIVLNELGLGYKKHLFGRMSEACVLYAMLTNFKKEEDDLAIYPIENEFVIMSA